MWSKPTFTTKSEDHSLSSSNTSTFEQTKSKSLEDEVDEDIIRQLTNQARMSGSTFTPGQLSLDEKRKVMKDHVKSEHFDPKEYKLQQGLFNGEPISFDLAMQEQYERSRSVLNISRFLGEKTVEANENLFQEAHWYLQANNVPWKNPIKESQHRQEALENLGLAAKLENTRPIPETPTLIAANKAIHFEKFQRLRRYFNPPEEEKEEVSLVQKVWNYVTKPALPNLRELVLDPRLGLASVAAIGVATALSGCGDDPSSGMNGEEPPGEVNLELEGDALTQYFNEITGVEVNAQIDGETASTTTNAQGRYTLDKTITTSQNAVEVTLSTGATNGLAAWDSTFTMNTQGSTSIAQANIRPNYDGSQEFTTTITAVDQDGQEVTGETLISPDEDFSRIYLEGNTNQELNTNFSTYDESGLHVQTNVNGQTQTLSTEWNNPLTLTKEFNLENIVKSGNVQVFTTRADNNDALEAVNITLAEDVNSYFRELLTNQDGQTSNEPFSFEQEPNPWQVSASGQFLQNTTTTQPVENGQNEINIDLTPLTYEINVNVLDEDGNTLNQLVQVSNSETFINEQSPVNTTFLPINYFNSEDDNVTISIDGNQTYRDTTFTTPLQQFISEEVILQELQEDTFQNLIQPTVQAQGPNGHLTVEDGDATVNKPDGSTICQVTINVLQEQGCTDEGPTNNEPETYDIILENSTHLNNKQANINNDNLQATLTMTPTEYESTFNAQDENGNPQEVPFTYQINEEELGNATTPSNESYTLFGLTQENNPTLHATTQETNNFQSTTTTFQPNQNITFTLESILENYTITANVQNSDNQPINNVLVTQNDLGLSGTTNTAGEITFEYEEDPNLNNLVINHEDQNGLYESQEKTIQANQNVEYTVTLDDILITSTATGLVTNQNGETLEGATINYTNSELGIDESTTTQTNGTYNVTLGDVAKRHLGNETLDATATLDNHEDQTAQPTLEETITQDFTLQNLTNTATFSLDVYNLFGEQTNDTEQTTIYAETDSDESSQVVGSNGSVTFTLDYNTDEVKVWHDFGPQQKYTDAIILREKNQTGPNIDHVNLAQNRPTENWSHGAPFDTTKTSITNLENTPLDIAMYLVQHEHETNAGTFNFNESTTIDLAFKRTGSTIFNYGTREGKERLDFLLLERNIDTGEPVNPDRIDRSEEWLEETIFPNYTLANGEQLLDYQIVRIPDEDSLNNYLDQETLENTVRLQHRNRGNPTNGTGPLDFENYQLRYPSVTFPPAGSGKSTFIEEVTEATGAMQTPQGFGGSQALIVAEGELNSLGMTVYKFNLTSTPGLKIITD